MWYSCTILAAFVALGVASPITKPVTKTTFTVSQVEAGVSLPNPVIGMLNTYNKYNATAPAVVERAAAAAQSGSVAATPQVYDSAYLCPVTIGTQTLNLNFDTGSADLWVFSTLMSSTDTSGHTLYDPSNGTLLSGETWSIVYGDGSNATGVVYADKVTVGGVTATSQAVEAATSASDSFVSNTDTDGLLGLSFSRINTVQPDQQTTFFDTVKSSLALALFTVDLKKGAAGTFDFGFIDSSKYTGDITYVDVPANSYYWQFAPTGYSVGGATIVSSTWAAIADTGTSLLYLPDEIVTAYYSQVTGAVYSNTTGGYIFPCSSTLPTYTTVIGGSRFTVPGTYMNYAQISNTYCFGGIQADTGIGFSIYGDIFLKSQFVVFSMVNSTPQLGFASQSSLTDVDDDFEEWYLECNGDSNS